MSHENLVAQAANPATPPDVLQGLASNHPELWPTILQNPSCYPELTAWISQQMPPGQAAAYVQPQPVAAAAGAKRVTVAGRSFPMGGVIGAGIGAAVVLILIIAAAMGAFSKQVPLPLACKNLERQADKFSELSYELDGEVQESVEGQFGEMTPEKGEQVGLAYAKELHDRLAAAADNVDSGNKKVDRAWKDMTKARLELAERQSVAWVTDSSTDFPEKDALEAQAEAAKFELENLCPDSSFY